MATVGKDGLKLTPTRGASYAMAVTVTDGKDLWATVGDCEARMQVRTRQDPASELVDDLTARLTKAYAGNDLVVTLTLTGAQTRALVGNGHYDVFVSDPGVTDAQAIRVLWGQWAPVKTVTSAA